MYEQLHILSPLVPPREFIILRCCQQIEDDLWVIADVSCHHVNIDFESPTCSKRPSGCLIQALPNGLSKVTLSSFVCFFNIYASIFLSIYHEYWSIYPWIWSTHLIYMQVSLICILLSIYPWILINTLN